MKIITDELELRKPCEPVKYSEIKQLLKIVPEIAKLMVDNDGAGIASVQVGIHKTFFLAAIDNGKSIRLFVNPTILKYSDEKTVESESCLSFPGVYKDIERSNTIRIKHFNYRKNIFVTETYSGFDAKVIQHEYDHLQGILCVLDKAV